MVLLHDGQTIDTTIAIDATGGSGTFVDPHGRVPAWQIAYGVVGRLSAPPSDRGCVLMDASGGQVAHPPSFLYAQQLDGDRWLVEETVLATRRLLAPAALRPRLFERLSNAGITVSDIESTEFVRIPMGIDPPHTQGIVAVGSAAGMIHPATGYSLANSLQGAVDIGHAIATCLDRGGIAAAAAGAAWSAIWPDDRRRARRLERFGLDVITRLDQPGLQHLTDAFYAHQDWSSYLSGRSSRRDTARFMRSVFATTPALRRDLLRGNPLLLLR